MSAHDTGPCKAPFPAHHIKVVSRNWGSRPHRHTASPSTESSAHKRSFSFYLRFGGARGGCARGHYCQHTHVNLFTQQGLALAAEVSKSKVTKQGHRKLQRELHSLFPCRAKVPTCFAALAATTSTGRRPARYRIAFAPHIA